jgi:hypothetical protein
VVAYSSRNSFTPFLEEEFGSLLFAVNIAFDFFSLHQVLSLLLFRAAKPIYQITTYQK